MTPAFLRRSDALLILDELIFQRWERLPSGCRRWNGTLSSNGSAVVDVPERYGGGQYTVKALLDTYTFGAVEPPPRAVCRTPGCAHPRHHPYPVARAKRSVATG